MAKGERNGTLRCVAIVVGIILALGGIVWSFAIQSSNLDYTIKDVAKVTAESGETKERVDKMDGVIVNIAKTVSENTKTKEQINKVENAVTLMQNDISYIQRDIEKIAKKIGAD